MKKQLTTVTLRTVGARGYFAATSEGCSIIIHDILLCDELVGGETPIFRNQTACCCLKILLSWYEVGCA